MPGNTCCHQTESTGKPPQLPFSIPWLGEGEVFVELASFDFEMEPLKILDILGHFCFVQYDCKPVLPYLESVNCLYHIISSLSPQIK